MIPEVIDADDLSFAHHKGDRPLECRLRPWPSPRQIVLTTTRSPIPMKSVTGSNQIVVEGLAILLELANGVLPADVWPRLEPPLGESKDDIVGEVHRRFHIARVPCREPGSHDPPRSPATSPARIPLREG